MFKRENLYPGRESTRSPSPRWNFNPGRDFHVAANLLLPGRTVRNGWGWYIISYIILSSAHRQYTSIHEFVLASLGTKNILTSLGSANFRLEYMQIFNDISYVEALDVDNAGGSSILNEMRNSPARFGSILSTYMALVAKYRTQKRNFPVFMSLFLNLPSLLQFTNFGATFCFHLAEPSTRPVTKGGGVGGICRLR